MVIAAISAICLYSSAPVDLTMLALITVMEAGEKAVAPHVEGLMT